MKNNRTIKVAAPDAESQDLSHARHQDPEPFVDAARAGEFLSLRPRRLLELARQGVIPGYPLSNGCRRVWRFRLSELAAAMRGRLHWDRQSPALE